MTHTYKKLPAYSLVEILTVIAIIGILSVMAFVSLDVMRARVKDTKRINEVRVIQNALEMYALDHDGHYPPTTDFAEGQTLKDATGIIYLDKIPANDRPTGACPVRPFQYNLGTDGKNYTLSYCLGSVVMGYGQGDCRAMPGVLCVQSNCSCTNIKQRCCGTCQAKDVCGGGQLFVKNFKNDNNNLHDLVIAPEGCSFDNANYPNCVGNDIISNLNWLASNDYCTNLNLNDFNDWSLPTQNELQTIFQNKNLITGLSQSNYWTATPVDNQKSKVINLDNGQIGESINSNTENFLRCLRQAP